MSNTIRSLVVRLLCLDRPVGQERSRPGAQRAAGATFASASGFATMGEHAEIDTGKGSEALERQPTLAAAFAAARPLKCAIVIAKHDHLS